MAKRRDRLAGRRHVRYAVATLAKRSEKVVAAGAQAEGTRRARMKTVRTPKQKGSQGGDDARDQILRAAAILFSDRGFEGTTMAQIADAVGMRGPSLYYHFRSKPDVLLALAEVGIEAALEDSQALSSKRSLSATGRLYTLLHRLIRRWRSAPYEMNCLFDPAFRSEEFRAFNLKVRSWLRDVQSIVRDGIGTGEFLATDVRIATYTLRGLVAFGIRNVSPYQSFAAERVADYIASFALRALLRDQRKLDAIRAELGHAGDPL